jgi:transcriptional regulator with XRE-family HTH domain
MLYHQPVKLEILLSNFRARGGFHQDLAAALGVSQTTVSRWVRGTLWPDDAMLAALPDLLDVETRAEWIKSPPQKPERIISRETRLTSTGTRRVFRYQSGLFYTKDGRPVPCGFNGASDFIGWDTVEVTPDMVGTKIARFLALETKTRTGKLRPEQKRFLEAVTAAGGRAEVGRGE